MFLPQFNPFPQPDPWWKSLQKDIGERQLLRWQNFFFFNYPWFYLWKCSTSNSFPLASNFLWNVKTASLHKISCSTWYFLSQLFTACFYLHIYFSWIFGLYQPSMPIMTFPILHPLHHLLVNKNVHLVSSVVIDLICFSWLIDRLHFLSCYFSFLNCSVIMPVGSVEPAATYTQFTKWC